MEKPLKKLLEQVKDQIQLKHYSYRTEDTYIQWIRRYMLFHNKRHPREMGVPEIEAFLSQAKGPSVAPPKGAGTATATQTSARLRATGEGRNSPHGGKGADVGSAGDDIQLLLDQAEQAIASVNDPSPSPADFKSFQFRDLAGSPPSSERATIVNVLRRTRLHGIQNSWCCVAQG